MNLHALLLCTHFLENIVFGSSPELINSLQSFSAPAAATALAVAVKCRCRALLCYATPFIEYLPVQLVAISDLAQFFCTDDFGMCGWHSQGGHTHLWRDFH